TPTATPTLLKPDGECLHCHIRSNQTRPAKSPMSSLITGWACSVSSCAARSVIDIEAGRRNRGTRWLWPPLRPPYWAVVPSPLRYKGVRAGGGTFPPTTRETAFDL